ncbi:MAG TPA: hypothetical protein VG324_28905, partial [Blastocatellia bacterium]|nr:hypothetical protein [Blastocatellia bacterium]
MTQSALTIWTNAKFPDEVQMALAANVAPHRLIYAPEANQSNLAAAPADRRLAAADIAFGQPDAEQAMRLDNLKWIHLTSAGYTAYDRNLLPANDSTTKYFGEGRFRRMKPGA